MATRVFFLSIAILMSLGRCGWMRVPGVVEWPWACLACALLVPMALDGIPGVEGFGDGSFWAYLQSCKEFLIRLCSYYFVFPLFVGGTEFPHNIVSRRVRLPGNWAYLVPLAGLALCMSLGFWMNLTHWRQVDDFKGSHTVWAALLKHTLPKALDFDNWRLFKVVCSYFDLYVAAVVGLFHISFAMVLPTTPTDFSLLGTRVMGTYLTMPLFLVVSGHFIGPILVGIPPEQQAVLMPCAIAALSIMWTVLTAQQILPEFVLNLVENGCADARLSDALEWLFGSRAHRKGSRTPLIAKKGCWA